MLKFVKIKNMNNPIKFEPTSQANWEVLQKLIDFKLSTGLKSSSDSSDYIKSANVFVLTLNEQTKTVFLDDNLELEQDNFKYEGVVEEEQLDFFLSYSALFGIVKKIVQEKTSLFETKIRKVRQRSPHISAYDWSGHNKEIVIKPLNYLKY
jgi:hypothetical protein